MAVTLRHFVYTMQTLNCRVKEIWSPAWGRLSGFNPQLTLKFRGSKRETG